MIQLHVLDFKIQIAVVAVKLRQRVLVVVKLVLLEHAAARQPGKHPALPGLELLAQFLLRKRRRADELDSADFDLRALGDLKRDRAAPGVFINVQDVFDLRVRHSRISRKAS